MTRLADVRRVSFRCVTPVIRVSLEKLFRKEEILIVS